MKRENGDAKILIDNPHIVAHYMHLRHTLFRDEIFYHFHQATNHWCNFEWKHHEYPHMLGFIWLKYSPKMDSLNYEYPANMQKE